MSTPRHYAHRSSASVISRAAVEQAPSLRPACAPVSDAAALARPVAARLQEARARVDALEGARRATLLRDPARRLAAALMPACRELAGLRTDPAAARDRLFLMARRAAVVGPAGETLAATGGGDRFARAARDLAAAREAVAEGLARRGEKGDPYGPPAPDALRPRRLLGEERHVLLEAFYKAFGRQLCRRRPAEAARSPAGPGSLAEAELCVRFAADQTVPAAFGVGDRWAVVFARGATRGREGKAWGAADDVRSYLAAIDAMLEASAAAAAARQGEGADAATRAAATHINKVVQAMGTGLRTGAQDAVVASTESAWQRVVRDILSAARGVDAVEELVRQVKESRRKNEELGAGEAPEGEHRALRDVAAFARREADLDQSVAHAARAGMLVRELGRRARREIAAEFRQASARQLCSVREHVLERVHNFLHLRLQSIEQTDPQVTGASRAVSDAVAILQDAGKGRGRIGREHAADPRGRGRFPRRRYGLDQGRARRADGDGTAGVNLRRERCARVGAGRVRDGAAAGDGRGVRGGGRGGGREVRGRGLDAGEGAAGGRGGTTGGLRL